jgi:hypothetical protein
MGTWTHVRQIISSPNGSRQVNELHSVSALAENDVWAAGVSYDTERICDDLTDSPFVTWLGFGA